MIILISTINGFSFISTRILNHGKATIYNTMNIIKNSIKFTDSKLISMPERYLTAIDKYANKDIIVNSIGVESLPVDMLIYDDYDDKSFLFYNSKFRSLRMKMREFASINMCLDTMIEELVYKMDNLYGNTLDVALHKLGSVFFRNSIASRIFIFTKCGKNNSLNNTLYKFIPSIQPGEIIYFNELGKGSSFLGNGWSLPDKFGVLSNGNSAEILIPLIDIRQSSITINISQVIIPNFPNKNIKLFINDTELTNILLDNNHDTYNITLNIENISKDDRYINIKLYFINAISPKNLGISNDERILSCILHSITCHNDKLEQLFKK
jgi:hypothetical protein